MATIRHTSGSEDPLIWQQRYKGAYDLARYYERRAFVAFFIGLILGAAACYCLLQ